MFLSAYLTHNSPQLKPQLAQGLPNARVKTYKNGVSSLRNRSLRWLKVHGTNSNNAGRRVHKNRKLKGTQMLTTQLQERAVNGETTR